MCYPSRHQVLVETLHLGKIGPRRWLTPCFVAASAVGLCKNALSHFLLYKYERFCPRLIIQLCFQHSVFPLTSLSTHALASTPHSFLDPSGITFFQYAYLDFHYGPCWPIYSHRGLPSSAPRWRQAWSCLSQATQRRRWIPVDSPACRLFQSHLDV